MPRIDDVLAVFTPGAVLTSQEVGAKIGVSAACAVYYLRVAADKGLLTFQKERFFHANGKKYAHGRSASVRFLWSLADPEAVAEEQLSVAPPAYRNLRLTENLTGYGSSLSRFASLCMMVRK